MKTAMLEMPELTGFKRDYDIPMSLPGNDDWDIYSTINEPNSPSGAHSATEEEDDGFNQWENNY